MSERVVIPARHGAAVAVSARQSIEIINTHGGQIVDMWAFDAAGPEHMSMPHSVVTLGRIKPALHDVLVTDRRKPIAELVQDSSQGVHCMLFAACDPARYALLGVTGHHDNCADNLRRAVEPFGVELPYVPTPLNLFMNTKFYDHAVMEIETPTTEAGQSVTFRLLRDCIVAFSACPQDLLPVNAHDCTPQPVAYLIHD